MNQTLVSRTAPKEPESFRPISTYVLKIASRCNLNCSYCYMYNLADKSYRNQPTVMSRDIIDATIAKVRQHALRHQLRSVNLVFHGGEPLLAGMDFFKYFVETANNVLRPDVIPWFALQTNGTLLSPEWLEVLVQLGISIGVSLDGTADINDANRVDHQGKGSYERIVPAIKLVISDERAFNLMRPSLAVINLASDPVEQYRHFRALGLKGVEFLFPDATYDYPPDGLTAASEETPYADWLIPIFDEWFNTSDASFRNRFFENIIRMIFGAKHSTNNIGGRKASTIVIETDGGIEPLPALKACGDGFTKVGLNILQHEIDEVYDIPLFAVSLGGSDALCDECKKCPIVDVCGGGYLPHRYSSANGFDNPSIYCRDLLKLITHIQERVLNALPDEARKDLRLATLSELQNEQESLAPAH